MAYIPPVVATSELSTLCGQSLTPYGQGKVRDTFELENGILLPVTTDRLSAFDFVMTRTVPNKGLILNIVNLFMRRVIGDAVKHDTVAFGTDVDGCLPKVLRGNPDLQMRAIGVSRKEMVQFEIIPRNFLTGSAWREYLKKNGPVHGCNILGYNLPPGLHDGSRLPEPILTASTKAREGHDVNVPWQTVAARFPWISELAREINRRLFEHAESRGYYLADHKLEFSTDRTLCDETATPDASRYWRIPDWLVANAIGKAPKGWDKEPVREYLNTLTVTVDGVAYKLGQEEFKPEVLANAKAVEAQVVLPDAVITGTAQRYTQVCEDLTGRTIKESANRLLGVQLN